MTSRQARRERREAERKSRKAEYQAAKAEARFQSDELKQAVAPPTAPISRAEISRANSLHSTGPRTAAGKARSSQNSFKHGLYSNQLIMPGEDPAELDALKADLIAEHRPANQTEHILVNEIAEHYWRIRRMRALEARAFTPENLDAWCDNGLLALLQRTMAAAERGLHKALTALRQQRKDRDIPRPAENGFVSQKSESGFVPAFSSVLPSLEMDRAHFDPDPDPPLPLVNENPLLDHPAAA